MKTIQFDNSLSLDSNADLLLATMKDFAKANGTKGFFFDFGGGETGSTKSPSARAWDFAWFMVGDMRNEQRSAHIFKNMNGETAAKLA